MDEHRSQAMINRSLELASHTAAVLAGAIRFQNLRPGNESDIYAKTCDPRHREQQSRFLSALRSARQIRVAADQALPLDVRHQVLVHLERREEPRVSDGLVVSEISRIEPGQYAASTPYAQAGASEHPAPALRRGFRNDAFTDLEFVALTPALGEYFGTDQGVLVTRAGTLNAFELREGDVILSINGRHPANAPMNESQLTDFANRYATAWSSQSPLSLASFYAENGSLGVNASAPAVGRLAIAGKAGEFMAAFPDMKVKMNSVTLEGTNATFYWTWTGTNTGPGGAGRAVRIDGYEEWKLNDGLITESKGHYDESEYERQMTDSARS